MILIEFGYCGLIYLLILILFVAFFSFDSYLKLTATVLEKVLYIENKHSFRKTAFELLMKFLQEVKQTDLVGAAINLQPLTAKYSFGINLMALPLSVFFCLLLFLFFLSLLFY